MITVLFVCQLVCASCGVVFHFWCESAYKAGDISEGGRLRVVSVLFSLGALVLAVFFVLRKVLS